MATNFAWIPSKIYFFRRLWQRFITRDSECRLQMIINILLLFYIVSVNDTVKKDVVKKNIINRSPSSERQLTFMNGRIHSSLVTSEWRLITNNTELNE